MDQAQREANYQALARLIGIEASPEPVWPPKTLVGSFRGRQATLDVRLKLLPWQITWPIVRGLPFRTVVAEGVREARSVRISLAVTNDQPYLSFSLRKHDLLSRIGKYLAGPTEDCLWPGLDRRFAVEFKPEVYWESVLTPPICNRLLRLRGRYVVELGQGGLAFQQPGDLAANDASLVLDLLGDLADNVEALQPSMRSAKASPDSRD